MKLDIVSGRKLHAPAGALQCYSDDEGESDDDAEADDADADADAGDDAAED